MSAFGLDVGTGVVRDPDSVSLDMFESFRKGFVSEVCEMREVEVLGIKAGAAHDCST
jgi:hypothetical protein